MLLILSASIVKKVLVEKTIPKEFLTHVIYASIKHHRCQDKCDYKATSKSSIIVHVAAIHNVQRYPCVQCDYKATVKQSLKLHVASVHKGQRWPCDQCDNKSTAKQSLWLHVTSIHERQRYTCDICDNKATAKQIK